MDFSLCGIVQRKPLFQSWRSQQGRYRDCFFTQGIVFRKPVVVPNLNPNLVLLRIAHKESKLLFPDRVEGLLDGPGLVRGVAGLNVSIQTHGDEGVAGTCGRF